MGVDSMLEYVIEDSWQCGQVVKRKIIKICPFKWANILENEIKCIKANLRKLFISNA